MTPQMLAEFVARNCGRNRGPRLAISFPKWFVEEWPVDFPPFANKIDFGSGIGKVAVHGHVEPIDAVLLHTGDGDKYQMPITPPSLLLMELALAGPEDTKTDH